MAASARTIDCEFIKTAFNWVQFGVTCSGTVKFPDSWLSSALVTLSSMLLHFRIKSMLMFVKLTKFPLYAMHGDESYDQVSWTSSPAVSVEGLTTKLVMTVAGRPHFWQATNGRKRE